MAKKATKSNNARLASKPVSKTESGRQFNELGGVKPNDPNQAIPGAQKKSQYTNHSQRPLKEEEYLTPGQVEGQKVLRKWLGK